MSGMDGWMDILIVCLPALAYSLTYLIFLMPLLCSDTEARERAAAVAACKLVQTTIRGGRGRGRGKVEGRGEREKKKKERKGARAS